MNGKLIFEDGKLVWKQERTVSDSSQYLNNNTIRVIDPSDAEKAVLEVISGQQEILVYLCKELKELPEKVQLLFGFDGWVELYNWIRYKYVIDFAGTTKCDSVDELSNFLLPEVESTTLDKRKMAEFLQFSLSFLKDIRDAGVDSFCNSLVECNKEYNTRGFREVLEKVKTYSAEQIQYIGSIVSPCGFYIAPETLALDIIDSSDDGGAIGVSN